MRALCVLGPWRHAASPMLRASTEATRGKGGDLIVVDETPLITKPGF